MRGSTVYPIRGVSPGKSSSSNEEVRSCGSHATPRHPQVAAGTFKTQGRVSRTRCAGVPDTMQ